MPVSWDFSTYPSGPQQGGPPSSFPSQSSHRQRYPTSTAPFNHLSKSLVDEPTPGCPTEHHEERCPSPEPSFHKLQSPQQRSPPSLPPGSPDTAPTERCSIAKAFLQLILKVPSRWTPLPRYPNGALYGETPVQPSSTHKPTDYWVLSQVSQWGPHGKRYPSPEPSFTPPGSLNRAPVKRDAPFLEPSFYYLSQFPINGPPPQFPQQDPFGERHPSAEPSTSHPLKIHLSLRVPGKEAPPCSLTGSLWTDILRHQSHWSICLCMSARVPKKESSYKMG